MEAGQVIANRYTVIAELASGGMGVTYRAWDQAASFPVVIKMPNYVCRNDQTLLARFRREIDLMESLAHRHIVPILKSGEFEGQPFVAMRFLPGGSLSDRVAGREKKVLQRLAEIRRWLPAVAEALDFLHLNKVVHRDIKPSNIFFDAFWTPFLGDFGLAKDGRGAVGSDLTMTNAGLGTIFYTAPEQLQGSKHVDGRADQYSLAVTVFECLAGRKPFTGEEHHIVIEILQHESPDLGAIVPRLPRTLCDAVNRALSRSSGQRFSSCQEFCRAALEDAPPAQAANDIARMLCPGCNRVIKLRLAAAGQTGRCPKCHVPMTASIDLSAFWLVSENPSRQTVGELKDLPELLPLDTDDEDAGGVVYLEAISNSQGGSGPHPHYPLEGDQMTWGKLFGQVVDPFLVLNLISGALVAGACILAVVLWLGPCVPQPHGPVAGRLLATINEKGAVAEKEGSVLTEEEATSIVRKKDEEDPSKSKTLLLPDCERLEPGAADVLANAGRDIDLSHLVELSPEAAKAFEGFKHELILDGIETLGLEAAQSLATCKKRLELEGLKELSYEIAAALSEHQGRELWLSGLKSLDEKTAEAFRKYKGALVLDGLEHISVEVAEFLAESEGWLQLNGLAKLEPAAASKFASHAGVISFRGMKGIDQAVAEELSKCECTVFLMGIEAVDNHAALALAQFGGKKLAMRAIAIEQCAEDVRRKLQDNGKVYLEREDAD